MKITVLLFGISTDLVGTNSLEFEVMENTSVKQFKSSFQHQFPNLTQLHSYAIAVNEHYADDGSQLKENDVVAIIPPVSGG